MKIIGFIIFIVSVISYFIGRKDILYISVFAFFFWLVWYMFNIFSYNQNKSNRYISKELKKKILARQFYVCGYPGCFINKNLHLHHQIPVEYGGTNSEKNLIYLCPNHHAFVHSQLRDMKREYELGVRKGEIF